jgi:hypothetical protein
MFSLALAVTDPVAENMQAPQEKKKVSMQSCMLKANLEIVLS